MTAKVIPVVESCKTVAVNYWNSRGLDGKLKPTWFCQEFWEEHFFLFLEPCTYVHMHVMDYVLSKDPSTELQRHYNHEGHFMATLIFP